MINRIYEKVVASIPNCPDDYAQYMQDNILNIINSTQLPDVFRQQHLDLENAPTKLKSLYRNSSQIITERQNIMVEMKNYQYSGFISSACIENYVTIKLIQDEHIVTMLYIDTPILVEDYKRLIDRDPDKLSPRIEHNLEVLYKLIYEAEYVFWDKFDMPKSNFDMSKLYEILSIRYRNCLGNMFFIRSNYNEFISYAIPSEMADVLNLTAVYGLEKEQDNYKNIK